MVVTGASRGFGKAVAEVLCEGLRGEGGHDVRAVITARTKAALKSTHDKLKPFTTGACVCVFCLFCLFSSLAHAISVCSHVSHLVVALNRVCVAGGRPF